MNRWVEVFDRPSKRRMIIDPFKFPTTPVESLLTGTPIGSTPYNSDPTYAIDKAFDGNTSSFCALEPDGKEGSNGWGGMDFGTAKTVTKVRVFARAGYELRLENAPVYGTNDAVSHSGKTLLGTLPGSIGSGWQDYTITGAGAWRYVYVVSVFSPYEFDVCEMEFYGT